MPQPAYLIAQLEVPNLEQYINDYSRPVFAQLSEIGAEYLVTSPAETLEGEWPGNWTVVIRFPDWMTAVEWYNSSGYETLKDKRINDLTASGNLVLVPGRATRDG